MRTLLSQTKSNQPLLASAVPCACRMEHENGNIAWSAPSYFDLMVPGAGAEFSKVELCFVVPDDATLNLFTKGTNSSLELPRARGLYLGFTLLTHPLSSLVPHHLNLLAPNLPPLPPPCRPKCTPNVQQQQPGAVPCQVCIPNEALVIFPPSNIPQAPQLYLL